ncbi:hypothetical protein KIH75_04585 [Bifidobacterium sp. 64T4]|uniref:hypothetical protein n=1 Tax=Bifidobacterium pongonis TaxID=2834432 RepID=UPI001C571C5C|nr:hypothetical protein [Bifidobacterium pongonis]MBW3094626.1 hypothetical protein [Bifidobacterium pongonis]
MPGDALFRCVPFAALPESDKNGPILSDFGGEEGRLRMSRTGTLIPESDKNGLILSDFGVARAISCRNPHTEIGQKWADFVGKW